MNNKQIDNCFGDEQYVPFHFLASLKTLLLNQYCFSCAMEIIVILHYMNF